MGNGYMDAAGSIVCGFAFNAHNGQMLISLWQSIFKCRYDGGFNECVHFVVFAWSEQRLTIAWQMENNAKWLGITKQQQKNERQEILHAEHRKCLPPPHSTIIGIYVETQRLSEAMQRAREKDKRKITKNHCNQKPFKCKCYNSQNFFLFNDKSTNFMSFLFAQRPRRAHPFIFL